MLPNLELPTISTGRFDFSQAAKSPRRHEGRRYRAFQARYWNDLDGFARECIDWPAGKGVTPYQSDILAALPEKRRVSVRGPHGLGKTALAAITVLWFALTRDGRDWKIPTTASAWRQLTKFLWPEIHKWARRLKWQSIGRPAFDPRLELLTEQLKLSTGSAFAMASDNPALIEGAHADFMLYLFDESKAIPPGTWDSAEGAFSTGETYWLAISTPGEPNGRFYEIQSRRPGYEDWWTRHVTLAETITAGRISQTWAEARLRQWGESSAVYQNRVLGEFASSEESGVIPLAWVERANDRWQAWVDAGRPGQLTALGVDVARSGEDKTVIAVRAGLVVTELRRTAKEDTMQTAGRVRGIFAAHKCRVRAVIDVIGVGAGVVDRLREEGYYVVPFNASERTDRTDRSGELGFINKRSSGWWNLREMLEHEDVALPPDDLLTGDLTAPGWKVLSGGKIQVESKDDIRKRLGRSTDDGDAVVMAFYEADSWLIL